LQLLLFFFLFYINSLYFTIYTWLYNVFFNKIKIKILKHKSVALVFYFVDGKVRGFDRHLNIIIEMNLIKIWNFSRVVQYIRSTENSFRRWVFIESIDSQKVVTRCEFTELVNNTSSYTYCGDRNLKNFNWFESNEENRSLDCNIFYTPIHFRTVWTG